MAAYLAGFSLSLSLILAIGAQNAFVLKQGLKHHYVFLVCSICAVSDAILISAGVAGYGAVVERYPSVEMFARYAGAIFLVCYSFLSFRSALTLKHSLNAAPEIPTSLSKTVAITLAFTWLNPSVYLDTLVLIGSVSTRYHPEKFAFGLGAITASFMFFFSLGYGAKKLAPVFQRPQAWQVLEFAVGVIMLSLAIFLVSG